MVTTSLFKLFILYIIYLFICLFTYLFIYLFIYLFKEIRSRHQEFENRLAPQRLD